MKAVKIGIVLLVLVTGNVVTLVVAEDLKPNNSHQQSLNDLFNISEIKKRTEKHSKEEIQKKYEEILKKSKEQYRRAIQEIEECKLELPEVKDDETDLVSSKSYYHADYTADDGTRQPCEDSGRKVGTLSSTGDEDLYSIVGGGHGYAFNSGPDYADFDLYVKWNSAPTTSDYDDIGYSIYAQELAHAKGSGTFYWKVRSYSGSGDYATIALIF